MGAMKRMPRSPSIVVALLTVAASIHVLAAPVTIKLATLAPPFSSWHKALVDMGTAWTQATEGRVKLTVYPGGTQGDESSTIRMMRPGVDQLQSGLLMVGGLASIDGAFNVFAIPFFFENDAEELHVQEKLTPILTKRLEAKGFQHLIWANAGWIELFSKNAIKTLDEVKAAKLFTPGGDDRLVQWYKSNGFHPVSLGATDIPAQLKLTTGMIDTAPMPPYAAMLLQVFKDAKYMLDLHVAPLVGGIVITQEAWNRIAPEDRAKMTEAAQTIEKQLQAGAPKQDADAVAYMKQKGLEVISLDAASAAQFRAAAQQLSTSMRGTLVPADIYDMAIKERDAFRKSKAK
jgi:TRAP-type C4-dicarboxylate transport system substrate-binding protein